MRYGFICLLCSVVLLSTGPSAHADDSFGPHFYGQTPVGLAEYTAPDDAVSTEDIALDDAAQDVQQIQPAAGEEASEDSTESVPAVQNVVETP